MTDRSQPPQDPVAYLKAHWERYFSLTWRSFVAARRHYQANPQDLQDETIAVELVLKQEAQELQGAQRLSNADNDRLNAIMQQELGIRNQVRDLHDQGYTDLEIRDKLGAVLWPDGSADHVSLTSITWIIRRQLPAWERGLFKTSTEADRKDVARPPDSIDNAI